MAAAKMCALEGEDDLSDFMVEIDILSECKHPNMVELYEAYFNEGKLWVKKSKATFLKRTFCLITKQKKKRIF